jgi:energy-coupling factor transport system permease protein
LANTGVVSFLANIDRDSWVHRLDPRTKVAILVFFSVIPLLFTDYRFIFLFILMVLPLWLTANLNFRPLISPFIGVGFFMLVLFVFTAIRGPSELTNPAPEAADFTWFIHLGPIVITSHTFFRGLYIAGRVGVPMTIGLFIVATTDPTNLGKGLRMLKMPSAVVFMVLAGLRFIPIVTEQMMNILDAMSIRGVRQSRFERTKLLILPLFITSLRRTRTMGSACEVKGFGAGAWNHFYQDLRFKRVDWVILILLLVLTILFLYIRLVLGLGSATVGWTR